MNVDPEIGSVHVVIATTLPQEIHVEIVVLENIQIQCHTQIFIQILILILIPILIPINHPTTKNLAIGIVLDVITTTLPQEIHAVIVELERMPNQVTPNIKNLVIGDALVESKTLLPEHTVGNANWRKVQHHHKPILLDLVLSLALLRIWDLVDLVLVLVLVLLLVRDLVMLLAQDLVMLLV